MLVVRWLVGCPDLVAVGGCVPLGGRYELLYLGSCGQLPRFGRCGSIAVGRSLWVGRCELVVVSRSLWVGRCGSVAVSWLLAKQGAGPIKIFALLYAISPE